jgi:hypothetical protein
MNNIKRMNKYLPFKEQWRYYMVLSSDEKRRG